MHKECIAMLLAGGEGSRLGILTKNRAKPAVPFGGKYRIIDFTLSNCVNSGIDTVGVLTQYQPLELNDYIGNGQPWDLDRNAGGVHILPPYQRRESSDWYKGTANAIYQNLPFIERYNPKYVIVLSGDHIYKMDYDDMLNYHKEKKSDCTIAVVDVSIEEASRFGIMNVNEDGLIYEFEEKPKKPKSTKASMGVYIFTWDKLKHYLENDEDLLDSSNDFGHDLIPTMLETGEKMYAYLFDGYWKDVGTIESLWDANMDLIRTKKNIINMNPEWKVYTRNPDTPPNFISKNSKVTNSIISEGSTVRGEVDSSIVSYGVKIEKGASVQNCIIMPGACIKKNALVRNAIVAENIVVDENEVIDSHEITVVGNN